MSRANPETFWFEGAERKVSEIRKMVPCLSDTQLRKWLRQGMSTKQEILNYNPKAAMRRGGRTSARKQVKLGEFVKLEARA